MSIPVRDGRAVKLTKPHVRAAVAPLVYRWSNLEGVVTVMRASQAAASVKYHALGTNSLFPNLILHARLIASARRLSRRALGSLERIEGLSFADRLLPARRDSIPCPRQLTLQLATKHRLYCSEFSIL